MMSNWIIIYIGALCFALIGIYAYFNIDKKDAK